MRLCASAYAGLELVEPHDTTEPEVATNRTPMGDGLKIF